MGCLSRYLSEWGWEISVVTTCFWDCAPVHDVPGLSVKNLIRVNAERLRGDRMGFVKRTWFRLAKPLCEATPLMEAMLSAAMDLASKEQFDLVIASSACTPFLSEIASRISKAKGMPWVADYRDLYEQETGQTSGLVRRWIHDFVKAKLIRRRNELLQFASLCTVVSQDHVGLLTPHQKNCHLIMNGYDPTVYGPSEPIKTEKFVVTYGGKVYRSFRDPKLLFEGLQSLIDQGLIDAKDVSIEFFVDDQSKQVVLDSVAPFKLKDLVSIQGQVGNLAYRDLMAKSSLLVVLSSPATRGVMTTKVFECMALARPVLLVQSDEGELAKLLEQTKTGAAAANAAEVAAYILPLYQEWKKSGVVQNIAGGDVSAYSREAQAKRFEKLFLELIEKNR